MLIKKITVLFGLSGNKIMEADKSPKQFCWSGHLSALNTFQQQLCNGDLTVNTAVCWQKCACQGCVKFKARRMRLFLVRSLSRAISITDWATSRAACVSMACEALPVASKSVALHLRPFALSSLWIFHFGPKCTSHIRMNRTIRHVQ